MNLSRLSRVFLNIVHCHNIAVPRKYILSRVNVAFIFFESARAIRDAILLFCLACVQLHRPSGFTLFHLNAERIRKERLRDRYSFRLFRTRFNDARKLNVHHDPRLWLFNQFGETAKRIQLRISHRCS